MRPDERHPRQGGGGIPDGLLIALLGFLVGLTVLIWSATGLAGVFAHGAWPDAVTFGRTPLAVRNLVSAPRTSPPPGRIPPPTSSPATASSGAS
ncbi:hypothetical protein [Streptomyces scabiei]|uniref:hypothetical protein n=1 Tax=Streptomyces scabiei TaxID=1930 RepID=UPI003A94591C